VNYGHADANPCGAVLLPNKQRRMPAVLPAQEARRVLAASERHTKVRLAFRNRAIIALFVFCGPRRAEVVGLEIGDGELGGWGG